MHIEGGFWNEMSFARWDATPIGQQMCDIFESLMIRLTAPRISSAATSTGYCISL
jgi:hypothetical protein